MSYLQELTIAVRSKMAMLLWWWMKWRQDMSRWCLTTLQVKMGKSLNWEKPLEPPFNGGRSSLCFQVWSQAGHLQLILCHLRRLRSLRRVMILLCVMILLRVSILHRLLLVRRLRRLYDLSKRGRVPRQVLQLPRDHQLRRGLRLLSCYHMRWLISKTLKSQRPRWRSNLHRRSLRQSCLLHRIRWSTLPRREQSKLSCQLIMTAPLDSRLEREKQKKNCPARTTGKSIATPLGRALLWWSGDGRDDRTDV